MENYQRPLNTKLLIENFLKKTLQYNVRKGSNIVNLIHDVELSIRNIESSEQTLRSEALREIQYRSESDRIALYERIINELVQIQRPDNDEKIKLGKGGALPQTPIKSEKKAFLTIGLPASGKSTVASTIADKYGCIIIDADFAKRKLPEYYSHRYGAAIVHEESSDIVHGFTYHPHIKSVLRRSFENNYNLVIPKIGHGVKGMLSITKILKEQDYEVHLILVHLDRSHATVRAIERFKKTKRYVPIARIFDEYGNNCLLTYFYLKSQYTSLFSSFGAIATESKPPFCFDFLNESPVKDIYSYKEIEL